MKRTRRLAPVQQVFSATEQDRARDLGAARQRVEAAQRKLAELRQYRDDYAATFENQARKGHGVAALRDFQVFLARLDLALRQQEQLVILARDDEDAHKLRWQAAARRSRALDTVVERWQGEERRQEDRREQHQIDERAQRRRAAPTGETGDNQ
ncbi:MAG: flagellar export protein FliJ [Steroidobacteraceae bacterium]